MNTVQTAGVIITSGSMSPVAWVILGCVLIAPWVIAFAKKAARTEARKSPNRTQHLPAVDPVNTLLNQPVKSETPEQFNRRTGRS